MVGRLAAAVLCLLMVASASAAGAVGTGEPRATVNVTAASCEMEVGVPCAVAWHRNATPHPGDDRVDTAVWVHDATVHADAPGSPGPTQVSATPSEVVVEHPVYPLVNGTWGRVGAVASRVAGPYLVMESRAYEDEWGMFLTAHPPAPAAAPSGRGLTLFALCSDGFVCGYGWDDTRYVRANATTVTPLPQGASFRADTTDDVVVANVENADVCWYVEAHGIACMLPDVRSALRPLVEAYRSFTPTMSLHYEVGGLHVSLRDQDGTPRGPARAPAEAQEPGLRPRPWEWRHPPAGVVGRPGEPPQAGTVEREAFASGEAPPWNGVSVFVAATPEADGVPSVAMAAGILGLIAWLLYHRVRSQDALRHDVRRQVFEYVGSHPGVRRSDISHGIGVPYQNLRYHIQVLARKRLLVMTDEVQARYFPREPPWIDHPKVAKALGPRPARLIAARVLREGAMRERDLSKGLRLAPSTVWKHARRLHEANLLARTRRGGRNIVEPTPLLQDVGVREMLRHP